MRPTILRALTAMAAAAAAHLALAAAPAAASERCTAPRAEWQPRETLERKLRDDGWDVRRIQEEDGCYEVYGIDPQGRRAETYFDPKTLAVVESKTRS